MWGLVCFLGMVTGAISHLFPAQLGLQSQQGHRVTAAEGTASWDPAQRGGFCVREECVFVCFYHLIAPIVSLFCSEVWAIYLTSNTAALSIFH